ASGATGVSTSPTLSWSGGDPDSGDTVTYYLFEDAGSTASTQRCSGSSLSCSLSGLSAGTQYAWRVVAVDSHGATTNGPTWTFTTYTPSAPTACFSASASLMTANVDGTCSHASYASALAYSWSFGDGQTGSGSTSTHTYACPGGSFTVTLTV